MYKINFFIIIETKNDGNKTFWLEFIALYHEFSEL